MIDNRSKIYQKSIKIWFGSQMARRRQHGAPQSSRKLVFWMPSWGQVEAKLHSKSTSKLLKFSTSFRIEFWSLLRSILDVFWEGFRVQLSSKKGV